MGRWFAKIWRVDTRACPLSMWISMVISSRDSHAGSGSFLSPGSSTPASPQARRARKIIGSSALIAPLLIAPPALSRQCGPSRCPRASKTLGRSEADLLAGFHKVAIRLYRQPEHGAFDRRHIGAQKWALAWTGLWCFPYPYAQISIIDTPEDGMGATGMEYETIYTTFSFTWLARWPFNRIYIPETVTIHEFTHGYWMGLVASNEFEESWMDEGINTFTEIVMVDRKYGSYMSIPPGIGFRNEEVNRAVAALTLDHDPIQAFAWKYATENSYGRNSYPQPGTTVQQIPNLLGEEAFWRAFRGYAERWRFDYPTAEEA